MAGSGFLIFSCAPPWLHPIWNPIRKTTFNELALNSGDITEFMSINKLSAVLQFCHRRILNFLWFYIFGFVSSSGYEWPWITQLQIINIKNKFLCITPCVFGINICQQLESTEAVVGWQEHMLTAQHHRLPWTVMARPMPLAVAGKQVSVVNPWYAVYHPLSFKCF